MPECNRTRSTRHHPKLPYKLEGLGDCLDLARDGPVKVICIAIDDVLTDVGHGNGVGVAVEVVTVQVAARPHQFLFLSS
ncbi:MAG: hypothetical protein ACLQVJ_18020 [Syntrophobacteraceae bacterium]